MHLNNKLQIFVSQHTITNICKIFKEYVYNTSVKAGETMKNRIKEFRIKKDLTQKECVKSFNKYLKDKNVKGITTATWSRWENGLNAPTEKMWNNLADFFNVNISYLKGTILDLTQLKRRLIPIIHNTYFDNWKVNNKPSLLSKAHIEYYSPEFVDTVNVYCTLMDEKTPIQFYSNKEATFSLSQKMYEYWEKNFEDIFSTIFSKNKNIPSNTNDWLLFNEFQTVLKHKKNNLTHDDARLNNSLTALGFFYKNDYDNDDFSESRMHDNMRAMLMHADFETAKKAINQYADLIVKLKNDVNNFDENKYFMSRLDNLILPIQNPFNSNLIMNEVYKRVHNGDTALLHYIMMHEYNNVASTYYNFKKKKGEDTKHLFELNKKSKQIGQLLQDDGFRSYLSQNYDFSTPNKIYDLKALYAEYKNKN